MRAYIVKRLLLAVPTLLGVSIFIFILMRIIPGDVALVILGEDADVNPERLAQVRERLGLTAPLHEQYLRWLWNSVRLDFGDSFLSERSVAWLISIRLPLTATLAFYALSITLIIAIPLGAIAAVRRDTWADYLARSLALVGLAIPNFWLGIMIMLFLVLYFSWLPPLEYIGFFDDPWGNFSQLIWPAMAVGTGYVALVSRITRSAILEVLGEDYVRTARAKGLSRNVIIGRHILRNAMLPIVTVLGMEFAFLLSGVVITEAVFGLPGIGTLLIQGIHGRDYPVVEATILLVAIMVVLINLFVDILYAWLDPRISYASEPR